MRTVAIAMIASAGLLSMGEAAQQAVKDETALSLPYHCSAAFAEYAVLQKSRLLVHMAAPTGAKSTHCRCCQDCVTPQ